MARRRGEVGKLFSCVITPSSVTLIIPPEHRAKTCAQQENINGLCDIMVPAHSKRNVLLHYGPSTGDFSPLTRLHRSILLFHKVPSWHCSSAHSSYLIQILHIQLTHAYRSMACLSLSLLHSFSHIYLKDYPIKID